MSLEANRIYNTDCLIGMKEIPDASIDLILTDLPYGTTSLKFDSVIPFKPLWAQYRRIIKPNHAIVLFATQPFTTDLINSNREWFKYSWAWIKSVKGGIHNAPLRPLKQKEDILVFSEGATAHGSKRNMPYFPQGLRDTNVIRRNSGKDRAFFNLRPSHKETYTQTKTGYPSDVLTFRNDSKPIHETQKPVALLEYLIRTYSLPGELVLDSCMGSASTAIAAMNTGRDFIGFETDASYFEKASARIEEHMAKLETVNADPLADLFAA